MNGERQREEITASLKLLATTYVETARQIEATIATLRRVLELEDSCTMPLSSSTAANVVPTSSASRPIADRPTFSVVFRDKTCFLGNTLLFRFFEVLARRPNRYFAHSELLNEVWEGQRADSSIRNVAKRVRDRLVLTGMPEVAKAIDGSTPGHFVLRLPVSE